MRMAICPKRRAEIVAMPYVELETGPGRSSVIKAIIFSICFSLRMRVYTSSLLFSLPLESIYSAYLQRSPHLVLLLPLPPPHKVTSRFDATDFPNLVPEFD